MAAVKMKETEYYKSGRHHENVLIACKKGTEAQKKLKHNRILEYNKNPRKCSECDSPLPYQSANKFCSKVCSGTFNSRKRKESGWIEPKESNDKRKASLLKSFLGETPEQKEKSKLKHRRFSTHKHPEVEYTCPICQIHKMIPFTHRFRKTCGEVDCVVQAKVGKRTYQNGSRKPVWFFNPYEDKEVLLDSSWEVEIANLLIKQNIEWTRPKFIKWQDSTGKTRHYFPDFYLPKQNVYLDPKNPYCMTLDKEKIEQVSKQVTLVVGALDSVIEYTLCMG